MLEQQPELLSSQDSYLISILISKVLVAEKVRAVSRWAINTTKRWLSEYFLSVSFQWDF